MTRLILHIPFPFLESFLSCNGYLTVLTFMSPKRIWYHWYHIYAITLHCPLWSLIDQIILFADWIIIKKKYEVFDDWTIIKKKLKNLKLGRIIPFWNTVKYVVDMSILDATIVRYINNQIFCSRSLNFLSEIISLKLFRVRPSQGIFTWS